MCSQQDDPTQYDAPIPSRPRKYELSGTARQEMEPSIALAVIGTMLDAAERPELGIPDQSRVNVLREARDRIEKAEMERGPVDIASLARAIHRGNIHMAHGDPEEQAERILDALRDPEPEL